MVASNVRGPEIALVAAPPSRRVLQSGPGTAGTTGVLETVIRVLAERKEPMRARDVHGAVARDRYAVSHTTPDAGATAPWRKRAQADHRATRLDLVHCTSAAPRLADCRNARRSSRLPAL